MDTKKLRQKILDLAIHGKLVPQDPNDEPASVLLERIRKEKEQLIKEGKIKAPKKGKSAGDTSHYPKEGPFEVPKGWCWCKMMDVCHIAGRIGFRGYTKADLVPLDGAITLSPSNIVEGKTDFSHCTYISWSKYEESPEIMVFPGDILLVKTGSSYGKVALVDSLPQSATINPQFVVLKHIKIDRFYLTYLLQSEYARKKYEEFVIGTAIPTFTQEALNNMRIPLPPYAEQRRIVIEVEKWFDTVQTITDGEYSLAKGIESCKSKILDLAIHGKLVPQDPSDEPAIELLKRINLDFKPSDNLHYKDCPIGWQVVTLKEIVSLYSGRDLEAARCNAEHRGIPYLVGASCIDNQNISVYRWTENPEVVAKINDTLLSCKGTVGEVILNQLGDVHIARQFMAIRSKSPQLILPKYIELIIKASIEGLRNSARGIIPGISREDILEMIVAIPPLSEQNRILTRISELENSVSFISLSICE